MLHLFFPASGAWSPGDLRKPAAKPQHYPAVVPSFIFLLLCRGALISAWNVATHSASVGAGTQRSISPKKFLNSQCNYRPPYAQTQLDLRWLDKQMLPDSYKLQTYGQIIDSRWRKRLRACVSEFSNVFRSHWR